MRPEKIDKLYQDRLGASTPTPPADLWNRLQDRIETEMPATQQEEKKPRGYMYLFYAVAAAIALVLTVGVVFFNIQRGQLPVEGIANNTGLLPEEPLIFTQPEADVNQGIGQVAQQAPATETAIPEATTPAIPDKTIVAAKAKAAIVKAKPVVGQNKSNAKDSAPAAQLVAQAKQPPIPDTPQKGDYHSVGQTEPAIFAANTANMNAQPVEIIIKRAVYVAPQQEEVELSGFEKRQKLAKNIFRQVRNLSNGEKVELSELGINADRIALETQIGKQKISKVINL